jgi:membrane fusion protein (multidrug efflux system)
VKTLKLIGIALLLAALALSGTGCSAVQLQASSGNSEENGSDDESTDSQLSDGSEVAKADSADDEDEDAVPVEVVEVKTGQIESILRFSSNLEAENEVQVFSQAKRQVRELLVEEGDVVARGAILIRLQDDEQRSQLAKVKSQLAKAEREYDRQKRLYEQQLISQQVFTDASFEFEQLKISVSDAERELGYTAVRAPIGGTVTSRMVQVGDQVQLGQHLFDLVDFESMVARVFVPEKHLRQLSKGLEARLTASAAGDSFYKARVERVSPIVDPKSGTVKVTIAVGNQPGLRPGLYVDIDLVTETRDGSVLIPKIAVVYDADQMFVYRLGEERRVERVFVEPRLADKEFVEPTSGIAAGDRIVIAGQAGLKNDALVSLPGDKALEEEAAGSVETAAGTGE